MILQCKTAVVLCNLGGPDSPEAVGSFLFNLFNDKAILGVPQPWRYLLAKLIAHRRAPLAREIYGHIGGKSPLLEQTQAQASALESMLNKNGVGNYRCFIAMRYWHPLASETLQQVKDYAPDRVVLLPLYPQFSTTTSASSIKEWFTLAKREGVTAPVKTLCCYAFEESLIEAHVDAIEKHWQNITDQQPIRLLFSAHGLPKKIVDKGDPYAWQVEQTALHVVKKLRIPRLDWCVCYQSKVGPLEWIGPSTEEEIMRAGREGISVMVVPIAFVSEHSETLVELDIDYKKLAKEKGVKAYYRVPALSTSEFFIRGLARLCLQVGEYGKTCSHENQRVCPDHFSQCPMQKEYKGQMQVQLNYETVG